MREITRSVKVALKCLIAVVLVDVDLPYWTLKVEDLVAFAAIISNICTAHAQKRLFMHFSCCAWRITWPTLLPSLKTLRLSVLELWVITFPVDYHRKCVRGYCACAESRDPPVGGQKQLHFWNPRPWFAYTLCTFGGSRINVIKVICENNARPCVKKHTSFCACANSRDLLNVT